MVSVMLHTVAISAVFGVGTYVGAVWFVGRVLAPIRESLEGR